MLNSTNAQFVRRMLSVPEGTCCYCGGTTEYDHDGYSSCCLRCFGLVWDAKKIQHSHMFGDNGNYVREDGQRYAWATTVDMKPAFVCGTHVGWFCAGGHGSEPCEWNITNGEAKPFMDEWESRYNGKI